MQRTAIVNLKHRPDLRRALAKRDECEGVVRIDRRTRFGNPYRIGRHGTREEVIALYRAELWRRIRTGEVSLEELASAPRQDPRLPLRTAALPRRGAGPRRRLGRLGPRRPQGGVRRAALARVRRSRASLEEEERGTVGKPTRREERADGPPLRHPHRRRGLD